VRYEVRGEADRRPHRKPGPAAVLGRLLYLVDYLYLALLVLGEDGGVMGAYELLAVELLERLQVSLCVLDGGLFACVEEHWIVAHLRSLLYFLCCLSTVHWLLSSNT